MPNIHKHILRGSDGTEAWLMRKSHTRHVSSNRFRCFDVIKSGLKHNIFKEYMNFLLEHLRNDVRNAFRYKNAGKTVGIKK